MRILQVIHGFLPQFRGGTELYLLGLARELRELGHEIHIVTGTTHVAEEPKVEDYEFDGFPISKIVLSGGYLEHWTRSFSPEATRLFAETVQRVKPDLVHVQHWFRLSRSLVETCHRMNVPVVCTLHDLWTTCPRIFRIRDESFCERPLSAESCTDCVPRFPFMNDEGVAEEVDLFRADFANEMRLARRIIVPSRAHGHVIADCATLPEDKLIVLPHGTIVPESESGERPQSAPESAPECDRGRKRTVSKRAPIRIGVWGHLFHMKGVHLVLEALQLLGKKARRFDLQVWGKVIEPRYKQRLEELSRDLDVQWHGAFTPEDVGRVTLDCAVIPSLCSESFSFVLDEAFDLGLPAIVSDRGALSERIGEAGAVFEAENPKSLATILGRLADEPERLLRWKQAIPELNPMPRHAATMAKLYRDVLEEPRPADLQPDAGLAWRRLEHQTRSVRRYEEVMFGQIGHIKREMGRGDHYEGEMRKLLHEKETWAEERTRLNDELKLLGERESHENKIISVLAAEIENFRQSLVAYLRGDLGFTPQRPEFADMPEHVPGLGPISVVVDQDHELLQSYGHELEQRRRGRQSKIKGFQDDVQRKERVVALLAEELKAFRELLTQVGQDEPRFDRACPDAPDLSEAIPNLGPIAGVLRENHELMVDHMAVLRKHLATVRDCESRIAAAENALEELRSESTEKAGLVDETRSRSEQAELRLSEAGRLKKALEKEKADLESRLVQNEARLLSRDAGEQAAILEIQGLRSSLQSMSNRCESAMAEVQELRKALTAARLDEDRLQAEIERLRQQESALEGQISSLSENGHALEVLEARVQSQGRLIEYLAQLMEDLRRGVAAAYQPDASYEAAPLEGADAIEEHVPGLGDIVTIERINREIVTGLLTEIRNLKSALGSSAAE